MKNAIDVMQKSLIGVTGLTLSKIVSVCNELTGLLIGVITLSYVVVKFRIAIIELKIKKKDKENDE